MALRMRRCFNFLFFFCPSIFHVHGKSQESNGFISLNCGANETTPVVYSHGLSMSYTPDDEFVENGIKEVVDVPLSTIWNYFSILLNTKRRFPNVTRGCYTFNVTKGLSVHLRAYFYYGKDGRYPKFDVYLGVNYWNTIQSSYDILTIIHFPTSKYLHLCLLNTGHGDPYINYIELRPIGSTSPNIYNTNGLGSLQPLNTYAGTSWTNIDDKSGIIIRYPEDAFDRQWHVLHNNSYFDVISTTEGQVPSMDNYTIPWEVVRSAVIPENRTEIHFQYPNQPINKNVYVVIHFAELQQNVRRDMYVKVCDSSSSDCQTVPLYPPEYLQVSSHTFRFTAPGNLTIISTSEQGTSPILNAVEEYTIIPFQKNETDDGDVDSIRAIKYNYKDAFTANNWTWIGDPCLPQNQLWNGITCNYTGNESPRITELNLSSLGLSGVIPQALANLKMLEKLDLSFNNLSGTIPDFLSSLQNLKFISIERNNITGPWPSDLLHKQHQGSIVLNPTFPSYSPHHANVGFGVIIAIAISTVVALICISLAIFYLVKFRSNHPKQQETKFAISPSYIERESVISLSPAERGYAIAPKLRPLTISEVNDLIHDKIVLGEGGFGKVYLSSMDGNYVAIKILNECNERQARDFKYEVEILSTVYHKNLVRVLGYCDYKEKRALVMEYVENNTLKHHLSAANHGGVLSWDTRVSIIIGAAQGLEYLHHGCKPPVVHRDIKPENILLTKDFEAKLADFGLSRPLTSGYNTSLLAGTPGYMDIMSHEMNDKTDVYSFGMVLLEVVTGKHPILRGGNQLPHWVKANIERGDIHGIVDHNLDGKYNENMAWTIVEIAMKCTSSPQLGRPTMEDVVKNLKSAMAYATETSQSTSVYFSKSSHIHGPESR